jgi:hypothetical protein
MHAGGFRRGRWTSGNAILARHLYIPRHRILFSSRRPLPLCLEGGQETQSTTKGGPLRRQILFGLVAREIPSHLRHRRWIRNIAGPHLAPKHEPLIRVMLVHQESVGEVETKPPEHTGPTRGLRDVARRRHSSPYARARSDPTPAPAYIRYT